MPNKIQIEKLHYDKKKHYSRYWHVMRQS